MQFIYKKGDFKVMSSEEKVFEVYTSFIKHLAFMDDDVDEKNNKQVSKKED